MRIGSSTFNKRKTVGQRKLPKRLLTNQNKDINPVLSDTFQNISSWKPLSGNWSVSGGDLSTSTSSSSYPILLNFDIQAQDVVITSSINSSGAGVVFWAVDQNNWWAALPFYTTENESYISGSYSCNPCTETGRAWGFYKGRPLYSEDCSTCYSYSNRNRYRFFIRLISSVAGVVSTIGNSELFNSLDSNDNINGLRLTTNDNTITVEMRNASNAFYGTIISHTATTPNKGYESGIIYAPGGSFESSVVNDITIVAS
jgi:hypothetical protein